MTPPQTCGSKRSAVTKHLCIVRRGRTERAIMHAIGDPTQTVVDFLPQHESDVNSTANIVAHFLLYDLPVVLLK